MISLVRRLELPPLLIRKYHPGVELWREGSSRVVDVLELTLGLGEKGCDSQYLY